MEQPSYTRTDTQLMHCSVFGELKSKTQVLQTLDLVMQRAMFLVQLPLLNGF